MVARFFCRFVSLSGFVFICRREKKTDVVDCPTNTSNHLRYHNGGYPWEEKRRRGGEEFLCPLTSCVFFPVFGLRPSRREGKGRREPRRRGVYSRPKWGSAPWPFFILFVLSFFPRGFDLDNVKRCQTDRNKVRDTSILGVKQIIMQGHTRTRRCQEASNATRRREGGQGTRHGFRATDA
jgi:hypothetical protein